jgi:hypothetical protein
MKKRRRGKNKLKKIRTQFQYLICSEEYDIDLLNLHCGVATVCRYVLLAPSLAGIYGVALLQFLFS